jgi:hypothetical protein
MAARNVEEKDQTAASRVREMNECVSWALETCWKMGARSNIAILNVDLCEGMIREAERFCCDARKVMKQCVIIIHSEVTRAKITKKLRAHPRAKIIETAREEVSAVTSCIITAILNTQHDAYIDVVSPTGYIFTLDGSPQGGVRSLTPGEFKHHFNLRNARKRSAWRAHLLDGLNYIDLLGMLKEYLIRAGLTLREWIAQNNWDTMATMVEDVVLFQKNMGVRRQTVRNAIVSWLANAPVFVKAMDNDDDDDAH